MLTSDLLVTKIYNGKIEPVYATLDQKNLEISSSIINLFQEHIGKTYGELIEEIEGFEEIDYRLIRGLTQILERRCIIEIDSLIEPVTARRTVFEECNGAVSDIKERKEIIERIARKLSIETDAFEKTLWADMEENLVIKEFKTITPENLLRQYNLSLTQTLLFKAWGMEIQIEGNYQDVFWKIKQLGLMYLIQDGKIIIDGPVSIFKMTERVWYSPGKVAADYHEVQQMEFEGKYPEKNNAGKKDL